MLMGGRREELRVCGEMQRLLWPGIMDQMVRAPPRRPRHSVGFEAVQVTKELECIPEGVSVELQSWR